METFLSIISPVVAIGLGVAVLATWIVERRMRWETWLALIPIPFWIWFAQVEASVDPRRDNIRVDYGILLFFLIPLTLLSLVPLYFGRNRKKFIK